MSDDAGLLREIRDLLRLMAEPDHHLKPLREADLLRQRVEEDGTVVFEWSNLFRRLPKTTIKSILGGAK